MYSVTIRVEEVTTKYLFFGETVTMKKKVYLDIPNIDLLPDDITSNDIIYYDKKIIVTKVNEKKIYVYKNEVYKSALGKERNSWLCCGSFHFYGNRWYKDNGNKPFINVKAIVDYMREN